LVEQQQNRRNQCSGVSDTDPPNKVDDVERPADRLVVAPDSDTGRDQIENREQKYLGDEKRDGETDEPAERRALFQREVTDLVGNRAERVIASTIGGKIRFLTSKSCASCIAFSFR
jgi:hypothetical protein